MKTERPPYPLSPRPSSGMSEERVESGTVHSYLHVLGKRKEVLGGSVLVALVIACFINLTQKPVYESSVQLVFETRDSGAVLQNVSSMPFFEDATFFHTQSTLIRSPRLAEKVVARLESPENRRALLNGFGVRPSAKKGSPTVFSLEERQSLIQAVRRSLSASQVEETRIISIAATGYDPSMTKQIADVAGEAYVEMNYEGRMDSFQKSVAMMSRSLAESREKIKTGEAAAQKINSEIELLEALKIYGERHPRVIQLRQEIPALVENLNRSLQNLEKMEIGQRKDLLPLLLNPHTETKDLSEVESDLYNLKPILEQEVNTHREIYNSIFKRLQETELSGGGGPWLDAKVLEPAIVPGSPIRPNKTMNLLLALVSGLFLGLTLAFFLEYLDNSIRSPDDVRLYLKLFPLGMVPEVGPRSPEKGDSSFWLLSDSDIPLYVAEAYRIIRTNLAFGSVDNSLKVIQVTSAVKGEGKTTTVANLGISLAQAGIKTLLVDADMRRPSLHRILKLEGAPIGLSEALSNGKSTHSAVLPTRTPNLSCILAGVIPPNPSELLASKRMTELIQELRPHFDMILIDSPPTISVSDASILASRADGIILVSSAGFVPRHLHLQAKNTLEAVHGKVIGCILNSVQSRHQPYPYSQYQGYADYYGEDKETNTKGRRYSKEWLTALEKLKALKEPLWVYLSATWARWIRNESKSSNRTP